jgi:starch phosphorylase
VREYIERHYLPAAAAHHQRVANKGAIGRRTSNGSMRWIRSGTRCASELAVETNADHHAVEVEVFLNGLEPNAVRVELYADAIHGGEPMRQEMTLARALPDASRQCVYHTMLPTTHPASGDFDNERSAAFCSVMLPFAVGHGSIFGVLQRTLADGRS